MSLVLIVKTNVVVFPASYDSHSRGARSLPLSIMGDFFEPAGHLHRKAAPAMTEISLVCQLFVFERFSLHYFLHLPIYQGPNILSLLSLTVS